MPITIDPENNAPLTPNHLLQVGVSPNLSPGVFSSSDLYSRHCWKQVQYLADQFWLRWLCKYLQTLQSHQKWTTNCSNLQLGNVVLVCNETRPRGQWSMGHVIDTFPDKNNVVRQVLIKTATSEL